MVGCYADVRAVGVLGDADNLRLVSQLWIPHTPSPANNSPAAGTALGDGTVDVTLGWAAGLDPANETQVNPIITKELVFLSKTPADPNLYYQGTIPQTGILNPSFPLSGLVEVTDYRWSIVETVTGFDGQTFTVGQSTLNEVDPNNILGPTWTFKTAVGVDRRLVGNGKGDLWVGPGDDGLAIGTMGVEVSHRRWWRGVSGRGITTASSSATRCGWRGGLG